MKNEFQEKAKANIVPHYVDLFIGFFAGRGTSLAEKAENAKTPRQ